MHDLTVCITSFLRPERCARAIVSCADAGIKNLVVFGMGEGGPQDDPFPFAGMFKSVIFSRLSVDLGCHELWLQAAYRSTTERLIILHDDDMLAPEFGAAYEKMIKPVLDKGEVGFASWRGHVRDDEGKIRTTEYFVAQTGVYPSSVIKEIVSRRGRLSLSPVISIFNRRVLIHALKETADVLPWLRPGMPLGTEIAAYLRHCDAFKHWLHVHRVLSYYGAHEGSGTIQAESSGNVKPLTEGYDAARSYCLKNAPPKKYPPRMLLLSWTGLTNERIANARRTWDFHFNLGTMLDFPFISTKTPKLHELMDYGVSMAMSEDIIVYANLDLAFTVDLPERILRCIQSSRGICVAWRRTMPFNPNQQFLSVKQGLKDGGVDLIAMTPAWWVAHRSKIPEMYVASNYWDWIFRTYCERLTEHKCYLDDGTYHAPHESFYDRVKLTTEEQKWNHGRAKFYFGSIGQADAVRTLNQQSA
jgi:hypothetical protein